VSRLCILYYLADVGFIVETVVMYMRPATWCWNFIIHVLWGWLHIDEIFM